MNKLKKIALSAAFLTLPLTSALPVYAADLTTQLGELNETAGLGGTDPIQTVGSLISVFLGVLGIIFLILVIYAGFLWMTAAGDEKKVGTAKNILISAVVGLVVILSAYAISNFVISQLQTATGNQ